MKILTLDCETTTFQNGNAFSQRNKLCYVGLLDHEGTYHDFPIEYNDEPYGENLNKIQEIINEHDCIVGFNLKFDLHWLDNYGIIFSNLRIFDSQLVQFILQYQCTPYPSLNDCLMHYGLETKLDEVKLLWEKGFDTTEVPENLLRDYLKQDVIQTFELYKEQRKIIPEHQKRLISLANQDLLVLLEIEKNGMCYDTKRSIQEGDNIATEIEHIDRSLLGLSQFDNFNPSSRDHVSCLLYGGSVFLPYRETYIFTYKDGRTAEKQRWSEEEVKLPRLVTPPKGSELKKEGFYATNEETLKKLRAKGKAKEIVQLLLKRSSLEKLRGTYLHGLPSLIKEMDWEENMIHGSLNQCVAITGRLSSSKPNLQNMDGTMGYLFKSRYE